MSSENERDPGDTGVPIPPQWSVHPVQIDFVWRRSRQFAPPTDVIELADRLVVRIEIAGLTPDGFTISLSNRRLTVTGRRERPHMGDAAYHRVEIGYGDFRVDVTVPFNVRRDDVTAHYQDGILQIDLPRLPDGRIHIINVGDTAGDEASEQKPSDSNPASEETE